MKSVLLVAAASFAALTLPATASAESSAGGSHMRNGPSAPAGPFVQQVPGFPGSFASVFGCDGIDGRDRHHRHDDRRNVIAACGAFGGTWGFYDPNFNRSWDSDSYNDWWHDRPDRAFPRWVSHNQNCTPDRMWWSGSGWHC